jgi:hypothetical protein
MESCKTASSEDKSMINLRLTQNQHIVREWNFEDENEFRVMYFPHGKDIQFLGDLKAPIKAILPAIRHWAQEWVSKQDLAGFCQALHDVATEWAAKNIKLESLNLPPNGLLSFTPVVWHNLLKENQAGIKSSMRQQYGQRNGALAYHFLMEMLMAMIKRYEESKEVPQTVWLFPEKGDKVDLSNILDWLFRRS